MEVLKPYRKDIGPVFIPIHKDTASHWFLELAKECGIKAKLHDLRHSAASYMLASGVNLRAVQEILGHAELSTTQLYAHLVEKHLHREMEKLRFE
ncbi:MAG: tyrosine-type recombinase/integrase, partial [Deltaproteobacteria bacterium]|nr:tyrosine-type recombinase/integrase [Deltaproteobacteria bacterium]